MKATAACLCACLAGLLPAAAQALTFGAFDGQGTLSYAFLAGTATDLRITATGGYTVDVPIMGAGATLSFASREATPDGIALEVSGRAETTQTEDKVWLFVRTVERLSLVNLSSQTVTLRWTMGSTLDGQVYDTGTFAQTQPADRAGAYGLLTLSSDAQGELARATASLETAELLDQRTEYGLARPQYSLAPGARDVITLSLTGVATAGPTPVPVPGAGPLLLLVALGLGLARRRA